MAKYAPVDTDEHYLTDNLLKTKSEDEVPTYEESLGYRTPSWLQRHKWTVLWNGVVFILLISFSFALTSWIFRTYSHGPEHAYSPARDSITYKSQKFDHVPVFQHDDTLNPNRTTNFNGSPRQELDEAWEDLTHNQNIRIKEHELGEFAGDESLIRLSDGSGYLATTAVFHGLHCVKRLHHYMYKETYYAGISDEDARNLRHHTEHCLDWLRQYIQCNVDTTLIPLHWGTGQAIPLVKDEGSHQCVNWEPLDGWMQDRSVDIFEPGLIVHPLYGNPFGEERVGDNIGITDQESLLHNGK